jgi:hypothetical protein
MVDLSNLWSNKSSLPQTPLAIASNIAENVMQYKNPEVQITIGSEAFWAMDWVKKSIKTKVTAAKMHLYKVKAKVNRTETWSSKSLAPTDNFIRAAMVYLPGKADLSQQFRREFRAFFMSWIVLKTMQPFNFRTDLIVVTPNENAEYLASIGCKPGIEFCLNIKFVPTCFF